MAGTIARRWNGIYRSGLIQKITSQSSERMVKQLKYQNKQIK